MTLPPGRPPFGGQGSLCASSLHAASYTLLPLRGISPRESMSLDSRLASLPYESSSFATLKGKQGIVPLPPAPLETESTKHRFPLRPLEGERATKWRGGAVRQEPQMTLPQAGRRLAVRAAFALHLYTQPRTPFCRCAAFPLKGKQEIVPLNLVPT